MLVRQPIEIAKIRVPVKRAKTLDPEKVTEIAVSILDEGMLTPIHIRADKDGYVLLEGLHRLEACRELGEETVDAYLMQARLH
jgi:ParB-like chromosome segregation protein Spo0J